MWPWRENPVPDHRDVGERLAAECEALLSGHAAQSLAAGGQPIPPWAWMNVLAHGTRRDLMAVAQPAEPAAHVLTSNEWDAATAMLAQGVLAAAPTESALLGLQQAVLVPVELALLADDEAALTPARLVDVVGSLLHRHLRSTWEV